MRVEFDREILEDVIGSRVCEMYIYIYIYNRVLILFSCVLRIFKNN